MSSEYREDGQEQQIGLDSLLEGITLLVHLGWRLLIIGLSTPKPRDNDAPLDTDHF